MLFEWDEKKNEKNRIKHGVWFEEAESVFRDNYARVFFDGENSEDEDRFLIIGLSATGRILIVPHCYRANEKVIRVISARKATKNERKIYEERI